jgi:hypothetical protein
LSICGEVKADGQAFVRRSSRKDIISPVNSKEKGGE